MNDASTARRASRSNVEFRKPARTPSAVNASTWFAINAMKSAFIPFDERLGLINDVVKPGYAALAAQRAFAAVRGPVR